jgi:hypothetical protein
MVRSERGTGTAPRSVVDLWAIEALARIAIDGDSLTLGALTTYTDIRRSALCREHVPALVEAAATIGAAQIQNRGTLGGTSRTRHRPATRCRSCSQRTRSSSSGSERGERDVPAAEFWTGYRQTALAHDELILRIRLPLAAGREMRFRKVGTRRAQAISKVVMAVAWQGDGTWRDVRVALGSVAATRSVPPRRKQPWTAGDRHPRRRTPPPRPSPANWHRSMTSAPLRSIGGSSQPACLHRSSATLAAGEPAARVSLAVVHPVDADRRRSRHCSKGHLGSRAASSAPARSHRPTSCSMSPATSRTPCPRPSRSS